MIAISEILPESRDYDFWTNHAKTNIQRLQAYMVRLGFEIAGIFGPL